MKVIFPTILVTLVGAVRIIPIFLPPQCWFLRVGITKLKQKIQHWEGKSTTFCRNIACVASVSVWFRSKERSSMVFDFCPLFFAPKPPHKRLLRRLAAIWLLHRVSQLNVTRIVVLENSEKWTVKRRPRVG